MKWAYILAFSILILAPNLSYGATSANFSQLNYYGSDNVVLNVACDEYHAIYFFLNNQVIASSECFGVGSEIITPAPYVTAEEIISAYADSGTLTAILTVDGYDGSCSDYLCYVANSFLITVSNIELMAPAPNNPIWGSAGLFGTTTNLASVVGSGVATTGVAMWPLLIFLGVAVAFAIAIKVQNFVMASAVTSRRAGDYKSFKRGKKELPGLWDK